MCGISGIFGEAWQQHQLQQMVEAQIHRGPDDTSIYVDPSGKVGLGHNRLSIIDLSTAGNQPMKHPSRDFWLIFNGEIYNYLELRPKVGSYQFQSKSDSELILAAYEVWGVDCLQHFLGMFAFALWDGERQQLFLARDRFGVKPLYYAQDTHNFYWSSEIKALHQAGFPKQTNKTTWSAYLCYGVYENSKQTFWDGVYSLPAGHAMICKQDQKKIWCWYDLKDHVAEEDTRSLETVKDEYRELMISSVKLRFRSDVPVAINLSGGLDSSLLLGAVDHLFGQDSNVKVFTFASNDARYDETPWVEQMLSNTKHPHEVCTITPREIPHLATWVQRHQDEPFGGFPTLAYSKIFQSARNQGIKVLLDGQGLDEQWAGYDYYARYLQSASENSHLGPVQGAKTSPVRPEVLNPEFRQLAQKLNADQPFAQPLLNMQYRDTRYTKIPRALRFNDRISMMHSTELREPFLDHRLFELAFKQPSGRKINNGVHKWLLREIAKTLVPKGVVEAPKRPLQTPQREWLRGELSAWVEDCLNLIIAKLGSQWFKTDELRAEWEKYRVGNSDNSFYIWQWVNLALWLETQAVIKV